MYLSAKALGSISGTHPPNTHRAAFPLPESYVAMWPYGSSQEPPQKLCPAPVFFSFSLVWRPEHTYLLELPTLEGRRGPHPGGTDGDTVGSTPCWLQATPSGSCVRNAHFGSV